MTVKGGGYELGESTPREDHLLSFNNTREVGHLSIRRQELPLGNAAGIEEGYVTQSISLLRFEYTRLYQVRLDSFS